MLGWEDLVSIGLRTACSCTTPSASAAHCRQGQADAGGKLPWRGIWLVKYSGSNAPNSEQSKGGQEGQLVGGGPWPTFLLGLEKPVVLDGSFL